VARDLFGSISGDTFRVTSRYTEQHGDALTFTFSGTVNGDVTQAPGVRNPGSGGSSEHLS
jgi:hypothetical protein